MNVHLTVQVPRSPDLDHLIDRFHHKLEPLLLVFQPGLVQLQGRLVRHTSREGVLCRLTLHLPTGQLSSEAAAPTAQSAFRGAGEELVGQLNKHKQRLRETRPRQRAGDGDFVSAPAPDRGGEAEAAARRRAEMAGYLGADYPRLLAFARRQVTLREHLGELVPGRLDPHEVLDEVVVAAIEAPPEPPPADRGRWLLRLAAAAMRRLSADYGGRQHGQKVQALDHDPLARDEADPEEQAAAAEMMAQLAEAMRSLPPSQRHDLVLYLLEGFQPQELAALSRRSDAEVENSLQSAETALRAHPNLPPRLRQRLRLGLDPQRA